MLEGENLDRVEIFVLACWLQRFEEGGREEDPGATIQIRWQERRHATGRRDDGYMLGAGPMSTNCQSKRLGAASRSRPQTARHANCRSQCKVGVRHVAKKQKCVGTADPSTNTFTTSLDWSSELQIGHIGLMVVKPDRWSPSPHEAECDLSQPT